jgi:thioredoxin-dependent peroxiredoxin
MKELKKGDRCPSFSLRNQDKEVIHIEDYIGKKTLVIYFYPKDETPGCTKEACSFRDAYEEFKDLDCEVIGISSDDEDSHKIFATKHKLPFLLLADTQKTVRNQFGVPGNLFGFIPGRVTYIIDKTGVIQGVFNSQVNFAKHISEAMKVVKDIK